MLSRSLLTFLNSVLSTRVEDTQTTENARFQSKQLRCPFQYGAWIGRKWDHGNKLHPTILHKQLMARANGYGYGWSLRRTSYVSSKARGSEKRT
jgi:hypothetical protein